MGKKTSFNLACLRYAWRDSFRLANALATVVGTFILLAITTVIGFPIHLPEGIPGLFLGAILAFIVMWIVVFACRFFAAAFHYMLDPHVRPLTRIRAMLGGQMWPVILMVAGICSFVVLFGGGAVWYMMEAAAKDRLLQAQLSGLIDKATAGSAAAKLVHLQNNLAELDKATDQYEDAYNRIKDEMLKGNVVDTRGLDNFRRLGVSIIKLIKLDFDVELSLDSHPNDDMPVTGEELISNKAVIPVLRRFVSTYALSRGAISPWKHRYALEIKEAHLLAIH